MTLLAFPGHKWHRCEKPGCLLCEHKLALCVRCGGAEISLPTDCPGELMTDEQEASVEFGKLNFRFGRGWVCEPAHKRRFGP